MDEARSLEYSINFDTNAQQVQKSIRDVVGGIGELQTHADSAGSAFRQSFLRGIDSGDSFASSLKQGVGGALTYTSERATDFKDNIVQAVRDTKDNFVQTAGIIGEGFTHPIQTIKNGLGGALQHARDKFISMARGAEEAAEQTEAVSDNSNDAEENVDDLGDAAEEAGGKFDKFKGILAGFGAAVGIAIGAATTAVVAFASNSVEAGMAFDSSISQVAATMGYTVEELNDPLSEASENFTQLREFAMEMGSSTAFSASQAADALNYMALAGYDVETSMNMLPNVLNLAAAGNIELAAASDMVTDAQSALGLTLDETSELVDKMAKASSKSNTSVAQLGDAILAIGGTAQNLAGGTTELSTALGILADNGIKGAEGGTHLRNIILSLASPSDTAAKALSKLGIEVFDAEGKMRPLNETFGDLNAALSTMSQGEQLEAIGDIFNTTDIASVNALLGTSSERWTELSGAIDSAEGAAAAMAETQLDNLAGDVTMFKSALEGAQILVSDALTPTLRQFTQFGTDSISKLTEAFKEGGLTGAMDALGTILSDGLSMIIDMLPTMIDAGMQLLSALGQGLLDNLPMIIDAAMQIITTVGEGILSGLPKFADAAAQIIVTMATGLGNALPTLIPSVVETVVAVASTIIDNLPLILDAGMQLLSGLADGIMTAVPILINKLPELINQIVGFLTNNLPTIVEHGIAIVSSLAIGLIQAIPDLVGQLPAIIEGVTGFISESLPQILEAGVQLLLELTNGIIQAIPDLVAQLPEIINSVVSFITESLPMIIQTGMDLTIQLATGIIQAIPELIAQLPTIISSITGTIAENLPTIISTGVQLTLELAGGIIQAIPELVAHLPQIISAIVGALADLPGMMLDIGGNVVKGIWDGISSMANWIKEKVTGFFGGIVDGVKDLLGIHSPSTVFADIGDNMALGIGKGFGDTISGVTKDIENSIPTSFDTPIMSGDILYDGKTNIVQPDITDINAPKINDVSYNVTPVVGDFDPPDTSAFAEYNGVSSEQGASDSSSNSSVIFSPVINITVQGEISEETIEKMRKSLYDTVKEMFEEFKTEELEHMILKNQYAF